MSSKRSPEERSTLERHHVPTPDPAAEPLPPPAPSCSDARVLVVNASQEMAKEITMQLTLELPGCSIMYAPSIELASLLLKRRRIDLVVSSPILPDGNVVRLRSVLEQMPSPPDVVVVGNMNVRNAEQFGAAGYRFAEVRRLTVGPRPAPQAPQVVSAVPSPRRPDLQRTIQALGADLRNDLNNPLQEIVAMVFVAKAGHECAPATSQALEAINKAAANMAQVVRSLEDKIRSAVVS